MFAALNHLERETGTRVTFAALGALVAAMEPGREEDYSASVVARWIKAEQEPKTREGWLALARALRVDPGWLAFGTGEMLTSAPSEPTASAEPLARPGPSPSRAASRAGAPPTKRRRGTR